MQARTFFWCKFINLFRCSLKNDNKSAMNHRWCVWYARECFVMLNISSKEKKVCQGYTSLWIKCTKERIGFIESDWRKAKVAVENLRAAGVSRKRHPDRPQSLSKFKFRFTVSVKLCFIILWKLPSGHRLLVAIFGTRQNVRLAFEQYIWRAPSSYVIVEYELVNGHWPWRWWAIFLEFTCRRFRQQCKQCNNKSHHQLFATGHERTWIDFTFLGNWTRRDLSCDERL